MATKLYVGGLAWATTDDTLRQHFTQAGEVASAQVVTERETGRSRGFGFVEMTTEEGAKAAIDKLNNTELDGRTISVSEARPKTEGGPRRMGGGFGGGNRGGGSFGGGFGGNRGGRNW